MFYCHLCKKHMWDANSFENHIKGRTHLMMREGIEESYRLKANMIRQEAKIAEQLKSIELDRLKRMGKTKQRQLEYCTMCDLNFHGHISAHRKSEGHLQLKKFLHPKCIECNKEFATRIDYDSHLLSADHLIKAAEKNTKVGERKRNTLTILTEEEELKDIRQPQKRKKKPTVTVKKEGGDNSDDVEMKDEVNESGISVKKETSDGGEHGDKSQTDDCKDGVGNDTTKEGDDLNDTQEEEDVLPPVDPEDCILDYVDGEEIPTEVDNRLPKYNWMRAVGNGLISKVECYECSLCGKFFDTEKTVEIHSRTVTHHRNFLKFINEKSSDTKIAQKRAAAAIEESERKRRRMEEAEVNKNVQNIKSEEGGDNEQADDNAGGEDDNGELYDPSEATGEEEYGGENGEEECGGDDGDGVYNEYEDDGGCEEDDDEMDTQNAEQASTAANEVAAEPEPTPEPAQPVVVQKPLPQPVVAPPPPSITIKTPAEVKQETPQKVMQPSKAPQNSPMSSNQNTPSTPTHSGNSTPVQNQLMDQTPNAKKGAARGGSANKSTRARGRGRYSRY